MIAIPAIDLRDGACVQLVGGSYEHERVRLPDPLAVARQWEHAGFRHLHVVDLDAATGAGENGAVIDAILDDVDVAVRIGGGVRTGARVDELVAAGAAQVIVGTRAVESPDWLADVASAHPGVLVVAADVRDRSIVTHGWARDARLPVLDFLVDVQSLPLAGILVTAVHAEGRMAGPDLDLMSDLVDACTVPIIASGGIRSRGDLLALQHRGIAAAVIGMALYTGALDPTAIAEEFAE